VPFNTASVYHFTYKGQKVDVRTNPRFIPGNWDKNPPSFTEYAGVYEAEVEIDLPTEGIDMIVDKDFLACKVYVNDTLVELAPIVASDPDEALFLTDFFDAQAELGDLLKRGTNHLKVISPTKLSEPLRLVGDFHVRLEGEKVTLTATTTPEPYNLVKDYPFFSGTVLYRAEFNVTKTYKSLILNLRDAHDSVLVRVNGQLAGRRIWPPYAIDIAPHAKLGANTLEIEVRNNMLNLIHGTPRELGLLKMPTLAGS